MSIPTIKTGVILLESTPGSPYIGFRSRVAGLSPFCRLALTLCRAGIESLIVLSRNIDPDTLNQEISALKQDPRFRGEIEGFDRESWTTQGLPALHSRQKGLGFLMVSGNIVTTQQLIRSFLDQAESSWSVEHRGIANLAGDASPGGIYLVSWDRVQVTEQFAQGQTIEEHVEPLEVTGKHRFWTGITDRASIRRAESGLIHEFRNHYTQLMDVYFNCYFSLKISRWLVKTPLTPNHLTLMGLGLGLVSAYGFARGDYLGNLVGGIFAAATAVWDCCDGDVARLKFMESKFGEFLDTTCDNLINVLVFSGMAVGVAKTHGIAHALWPFALLALGGTAIFLLIYFPRGMGKGAFFKGTRMYELILLLASRNFIYIILVFAIVGKPDWFLWLAGFGSWVFALGLYLTRRKIFKLPRNNPKEV